MKKSMLALAATLAFSTICFAQTPSFTVVSPNGGTLTNGTVVTINWIPPVGVNTVRISLNTDHYHGTYITQMATNSGQYSWVVNRQNYDRAYYSKFFISIDGCTTNHWCGVGDGEYFTLVDNKPKPANVTSVSKVYQDSDYQYFEIDATGDSGFTHYLEYSTDMSHWTRFEESLSVPVDGNLLWYVQSTESKLFFRVAATY